MQGDKCVVCGSVEKKGKDGPENEMIDGAPYIKGLVCHGCDGQKRTKHRQEA